MKKLSRFILLLILATSPMFVFAQTTSGITHNLYLGLRSSEIILLQQKLQELGYFPSTIQPTGYFGMVTRKAVHDFQRANAVPTTGYVGPLTRQVLSKMVSTPRSQGVLQIELPSTVVKVGDAVQARVVYQPPFNCPSSAPCPPPPVNPPLEALWISNNTDVATVSLKQETCSSSVPTPNAGCFDPTTVEIRGISTGTAEISTTHTFDNGNKLTATTRVTVVPVSTASVTLLSPNGGEKIKAGDISYLSWQIINGPLDIWVGRITLSKGGSFVTDIIPFPSGFQPNTVSVRWNVPQNLATGDDYRANVILFQGPTDDRARMITTDSSDAPFSIVSQ